MSKDEIRSVLPVYFDIQENRKHARFQVIKAVPVEFDRKMSIEELWDLHVKGLEHYRELDLSDVPDRKEGNLLDLKAEIANRTFENCILCERRCKVNRKKGEPGSCGVLDPRISSEFLHFGEEPELVPSHTIFFAGCTFKCVFCQNHDISQDPYAGAKISPKQVARTIDETSGRNVNWVGGDPTSNLPFILEVLKVLDVNVSQVWNSNMYLTEETMRLLDGVTDVYLTDFKYGNNECGERFSKVKDYFDIITRNHLEANRQCEMIIRHLVLPNHVDCCSKPILDWIAKNLDNERVRVNIMQQYRPEHLVRRYPNKYPSISKSLGLNEWLKAYEHGKRHGLNLV